MSYEVRNLGRGISTQKRMQISYSQHFLMEVPMTGVHVLDLKDLLQLLSVTSVLSATSRLTLPPLRLIQRSLTITALLLSLEPVPAQYLKIDHFLDHR